MQRVDEGSDYTRKRRSLSDTRTGKYERATRVAWVAGRIYRAPLLHSVDAFVKFSLNLGPIVPLLLVSRSERGHE